MTASVFYNELSRLMAEQPPALADAAILETLAGFGLEAGKAFKFAQLGLLQRWLLEKSMTLSRWKQTAHPKTIGPLLAMVLVFTGLITKSGLLFL